MQDEVLLVFGEVADLARVERELYFERHLVNAEIRAEVESLLNFDAPDVRFAELVAGEAAAFLEADSVPPEGQCGPYRLIRLLGRGGAGEVFLGERTDGQIEQRVAVKLIQRSISRPSFRYRFLRERQILASLQHPGIARLLDAGETPACRPYLVLEYIDGVPIDDYAAPLDLQSKLRLFLKVCDAVSYAHRNLIIHRDIKPSNILVDADGQPKLLDFGIAKILHEATDQTRTQDRLLTPDYASPEQVRGAAQTTATDVYSVGAVLYALLTGHSPHTFATRTPEAIDLAICTVDPIPAKKMNPDIPADLDFILRKALRKKPEDRYSSVEALGDDLLAFLEWRPIRARSGNAWYHVRGFVRRYHTMVVATVTVILSLAAGLYIANRQRAIAEHSVTELRQVSRQLLDYQVRLSVGTELTLRRKIITSSIKYLEDLDPESFGDKQLKLEIGYAYLNFARIQGVPEWNQQGQYAEAEKSLSKVTEIADSVLAADPTNREALWQSANAAHDRAVIAYVERHPDQVIAWSPRAVDGFDRLARLKNLTRREINAATYIYGDLAEVYIGLHRFEDAVHYARLAIDYSQNISTVPGPRAQAFNMLAGALQYQGDLQGAQEAVREAHKLWEQLLRDEGDQYYTRTMQYQTRCREALLLAEEGSVNLNRPQEAVDRLQEAFDALTTRAQKDRNSREVRIMLATDGHYLGDLLRHTNPKRALVVYDRSLVSIREVPDDVNARRTEVLLLAGSSYAARRLHHENDAQARLDAAFRLLLDVGEYPALSIRPGSEADISVRAQAAQYAETSRIDQAIQSYKELRRALLASNPDTGDDLPNAASLTALDSDLAALLRRAGAKEQAAALEEDTQGLWRQWDRRLPNNPFVQREITSLRSVSSPLAMKSQKAIRLARPAEPTSMPSPRR